jgi:CRP-like cAMP-binding protein
MEWRLYLTGLFWGTVSAVSLPLGAIIGLWVRPPRKVTSALMAFGAGALLFALTIELFGHALHMASDQHGNIVNIWVVTMTMAGAAVGGLLFELLNQILNNKGAFLRNGSLMKKHLTSEKRRQARALFRGLSRVKVLQKLPAEEIIKLIPYLKTVEFQQGQIIFEEGDTGDSLYFIVSGKVNVSRFTSDKSMPIATLGAYDIFGEMALFFSHPRNATVTAQTPITLWQILKSDFDYLLQNSTALQKAVGGIVKERIQDLSKKEAVLPEEARRWEQEAVNKIDRIPVALTDEDIKATVKEHHQEGGAALSIWLGIALDGIPESIVIGMLVVTAAAEKTAMSLAFIAGVFMANLPEAMSSAVTMRNNNQTIQKIFWMWMSLCIMTGMGAFAGAWIFPPDAGSRHLYFVFSIKGIAAGAMLTMIAETMLPEAFEQGGGTIVGLSTLVGFLAALAVKLVH